MSIIQGKALFYKKEICLIYWMLRLKIWDMDNFYMSIVKDMQKN